MTLKKSLGWLAGLITAGFVIGVALPLLIERLTVNEKLGFQSEIASFHLKDEAGRRHQVFMANAHAGKDLQFFEYAVEAPKDKDLSPWHKQIVGMSRDKVTEIDGFVWSDKGFLWGDYKAFGDNIYKKGERLGLTLAGQRRFDQLELTQPGSPWDIQSNVISVLGKFPTYDFNAEDKNFKFDLKLTSTGNGWYPFGNGVPFPVGDFGLGTQSENPGSVAGTITNKVTGESFKVKGVGIMEDAAGFPWSWIDWGAHDWSDFHFPGGWSGAVWKAKDDWQWGYHATPHLGFMWDPILKKNLAFYRTELIDVEYVKDEITGLEYPGHALWRAVGPDGTLELENKNLTFKPRETRFPVGPFELGLRMSYGYNTSTARLIRPDGSVVELKDGIGTLEHFTPLVPDYVFWGPLSLVLLVLSWGAYRVVARREAGLSVITPVLWSIAGLIAIGIINLAWSIQ